MISYNMFSIVFDTVKDLNENMPEYEVLGKVKGFEVRKNNHLLDKRDGSNMTRVGNVSDAKLLNNIVRAFKQGIPSHGVMHIIHKNPVNSKYSDQIVFIDVDNRVINIKTYIASRLSADDFKLTKAHDQKIILEQYNTTIIILLPTDDEEL